MIADVLLSVSVIVLGAQAPKPSGWIAIGLGVLVILGGAMGWHR